MLAEAAPIVSELRAAKERLAVLLAEKVRRAEARDKALHANFTPEYIAFQKYYWDKPGEFVDDCINWKVGQGATEYQKDCLDSLVTEHRVCVRGPHTLGKTALNAWAILWFALTRDGEDWKCPTTASAWRQLNKFLWPEVHKWARRLNWAKIGRPPFDERTELHDTSLRLSTGEAFALASDKSELIEGAHADFLFYILDEAKAIAEAIWDGIEGAFAGEGEVSEAMALACSTPGEPQGKFFDIQTRKPGTEDWKAIFVTFRRVLRAKRISLAWARQRAKAWGTESAIYLNRVMGEFAIGAVDGVIPLRWVEAANERWLAWRDEHNDEKNRVAWPTFTGLGVDVGRGGDASTAARRHGNYIASIEKRSTPDTMQLVGLVRGILDKHGGYAVVDVIGVGAGATDRLREIGRENKAGWDIFAFGAGEKTDAKDSAGELGFVNKRSHGWWHLRELLDPSTGADIGLPPDDELIGDLTAATYRVGSSGIAVEEKKEIKKRLGRSPDEGDSVMMAFYPVEQMMGAAGRVLGVMEQMMAARAKILAEAEEKRKQEEAERNAQAFQHAEGVSVIANLVRQAQAFANDLRQCLRLGFSLRLGAGGGLSSA